MGSLGFIRGREINLKQIEGWVRETKEIGKTARFGDGFVGMMEIDETAGFDDWIWQRMVADRKRCRY